MLIFKNNPQAYKMYTQLEMTDDMYTGDSLEMYCQYESSSPMTLKKFNEIQEKRFGAVYKQDYELYFKDKPFDYEDMIIDDSVLKEPLFQFRVLDTTIGLKDKIWHRIEEEVKEQRKDYLEKIFTT